MAPSLLVDWWLIREELESDEGEVGSFDRGCDEGGEGIDTYRPLWWSAVHTIVIRTVC